MDEVYLLPVGFFTNITPGWLLNWLLEIFVRVFMEYIYGMDAALHML